MEGGLIVNGKINEFVQWFDTDGNIINASDGGIIYVDGNITGMARRFALCPVPETVWEGRLPRKAWLCMSPRICITGTMKG